MADTEHGEVETAAADALAQDTRTRDAVTAAGHEMPEDPAELRRELEKARKQISLVNKESAERRRKLEEIERRDEEAKAAKMSEEDRLKKIASLSHQKAAEAEQRAAAAERALVDTRINHAVEREAALARFQYPHLVPNMVDRSLVEFDPESGEVRGAKKAVDKLLKECPGLAESHAGGGTPSRTGPRQGSFQGGGGTQTDRAPALTPREEMLAAGGYSF